MSSNGITITAQNRGPVINILSWILMVVMCLATLVKVYSKWSIMRTLEADDYYLTAAMVAAAGWVITISIQVAAGLGRQKSTLTSEQIVRFQQAAYSSHYLYVVSLCLAKMAILHFLLTLARKNNRRLVVKVTMMFNMLSLVVAAFAIAFQCPLPRPWLTLSDRCFDQKVFWDAFGAMDIVIDLATVVLPFFLLHDLHIAWAQKLPAMVAFALRALIIPLIIARLIFLSRSSSTDHPYDDFSTTVITSIHINLSVVITCLPFLKTVIDSLQTGLLASDLRILGPRRISHHHAMGYLGKVGRLADKAVPSSNRQFRGREDNCLATTTVTSEGEGKGWKEEGGVRLEHNSSKEKMVINHTTTMSVHYN